MTAKKTKLPRSIRVTKLEFPAKTVVHGAHLIHLWLDDVRPGTLADFIDRKQAKAIVDFLQQIHA
jgi:hypothetical protein